MRSEPRTLIMLITTSSVRKKACGYWLVKQSAVLLFYAWRRSPAVSNVQLHLRGGARPGQSPVATDPRDHGRGASPVVESIRPHVFANRPAFHTPGETPSSSAATGVVYDPE